MSGSGTPGRDSRRRDDETGSTGDWAVILTGFQNDFCSPGGALARAGRDLTNIQAVLPRVAGFLAEIRRRSLPVIHLRATVLPGRRSDSEAWRAHLQRAGLADSGLLTTTWGEDFVQGLSPLETEHVVDRFRSGGLGDARTDVLLRSWGARRLLIAGVESHDAVLATAVQATSLDYLVTVVEDCVASSRPDAAAAAAEMLAVWAVSKRSHEVLRDLAELQSGQDGQASNPGAGVEVER